MMNEKTAPDCRESTEGPGGEGGYGLNDPGLMVPNCARLAKGVVNTLVVTDNPLGFQTETSLDS